MALSTNSVHEKPKSGYEKSNSGHQISTSDLKNSKWF